MAAKMDPTARGRRIADARMQKQWSQKDLANAVGTWPGTINRIEHAVYKGANMQLLESIANALDRPLHWILYGDEPTSSRVRTKFDSSYRGYAEFIEHSPLAPSATDDELRALLSIEWPPNREPTRALYEKLLIDMRSELREIEHKKKHAKHSK